MKISEEFDAIVGFAREEAMRTGSYTIEADHLLLGILRHGSSEATDALRRGGIDIVSCKTAVDSMVFHEHSIPYGSEDDIRLGREGSNTVSLAIADAMAEGSPEASARHLLRAILKQENSRGGSYLRSKGLRPEALSSTPVQLQADTFTPGKKEMAALLSTLTIRTGKTIAS